MQVFECKNRKWGFDFMNTTHSNSGTKLVKVYDENIKSFRWKRQSNLLEHLTPIAYTNTDEHVKSNTKGTHTKKEFSNASIKNISSSAAQGN